MSKIAQKEGAQEEQVQNVHQHRYQSKMKIESIEEIKNADKQQLQKAYTIWVMVKQNKYQSQDSYENILKPLTSFKTVEDFWAVQQHIKRPTNLTFGTFMNVFVDGVKPMWEDEACKDGGRWSLRVPKSHTNKYWEDLLLAMIGEQFRSENEVLGLAISIKPNVDTISVWHKSGKDTQKIQTIKEDIETFLQLKADQQEVKIDYENFAEVLSRPKQEKPVSNAFTRNQNVAAGAEGEHQSQHNDGGFEKRQVSRGGGFITRGRGRGRGQ